MATREVRTSKIGKVMRNEQGVSFMAVMLITLMMGALGVAALTMTGLENSMAGAIRMVEEGTSAAESCIGTAVNVIQQSIDEGAVPPSLLSTAAPPGPVPPASAALLGQEINGTAANNPDIAVGGGSNPNLVININNYVVNGDIDFQFRRQKSGGTSSIAAGYDGTGTGAASVNMFYRVDCTAANAATGATSHVIAVYECLANGDGCTRRTY
jgi:Tfp pilus assembly protein PilX